MSQLPLGFLLIEDVVPLGPLGLATLALTTGKKRAGRRDLLSRTGSQFLINNFLQTHAASVLGDGCFALGATMFTKSPRRNWKVPWHQDLSVPAAPSDLPVTYKDEIPHVQPGAAILEQLLAVRLHIDDAGPDEGGLRVVPNSHTLGVVPEASLPQVISELGQVPIFAPQGSVVLIRPLLIHSSPSARRPKPRRVLHVLFAPETLTSYPWAFKER